MSVLPEKKKWVGDKQIDTAGFSDKFDIEGKQLVRITYIQGGIEYFTQKALEGLVTDKIVDATTFQANRWFPVVNEIMRVLAIYGTRISELELMFMVNLIQKTLNERLRQADSFLWGVDEYNRTIIDLAEILTQREKILAAKNATKSV